MYVVE
jgi:hypothetical protein